VTWRITAEPERFDEAVEFFSAKVPLTQELIDELGEHAGPRAWTIAGVTQLDVVQFVHDELERAIESGIPFEEWQATVADTLTEAWGKRDSARMLTVFINCTQQSYNAGRWAQMTDPQVLELRPFGMYDSVVDTRTSPFCRAWDGVILPLEEFAERGACPQTHHRCRAGIRSLRKGDADRRGGPTKALPTDKADEGFGGEPTTTRWTPDRARYDRQLWNEYKRKAAELEESPRPRMKKTG
jgi:SPP1 gp7 family putative phage head morphogenesis protein